MVRHNINRRNVWLKKPILAHGYQKWLIDNDSLTLRLQQHYTNFSVKPVRLQYAKPLSDEATLLSLTSQQVALIREVQLMGNNQAMVFAHSVLPRMSMRGAWRGLNHLGNKPLGAMLFANPKVKRTPLEFKKLSQQHLLYKETVRYLSYSPTCLWARRSIFSLTTVNEKCANILVTEIFLPQILVK
jgi:chorismate lyase